MTGSFTTSDGDRCGAVVDGRRTAQNSHRGIGPIPLGRCDGVTIILSADPRPRAVPYAEAVADTLLQALLSEPAVVDPPRRVRRDWLLLGAILTSVTIEGVVRPDLTWRPAAIVVFAALAFTTLWRRTHPLAAMAATFGTILVLDHSARLVAGSPVESFSSAFLLVLVYALFRWDSGRNAAIGLGIMAVMLVSSLTLSWTGIGDAIGGTLVLLFPAVLGAEVRHLGDRSERRREEVKIRERELLARELHDTVAHHVSAIAIQAQAGQFVGRSRPDAALDALAVIEGEASRTLAEMRSIVANLRGAAGAEYAPQPGLGDIERLAAATTDDVDQQIVVDVCIDDGLGVVSPAIGTAAYRIAQEALTNARCHAHGATRVAVRVEAVGDDVRISVDDNGRVDGTPRGGSGFGLTGMAERAHLLGGELHAGPRDGHGWAVTATIPMDARS